MTTKPYTKECARMYLKGMSLKQISAELLVGVSTVTRRLEDAGVARRHKLEGLRLASIEGRIDSWKHKRKTK